MAENRLIALRGDTDVFTTFEGDNHVLTQLVAKELLTAYADDIRSMSPSNGYASPPHRRHPGAETHCGRSDYSNHRRRPAGQRGRGQPVHRGTQVKMFEDRENTCCRRLRVGCRPVNEMSAFDAFNAVQDHVLHAASAHVDRVVLEAFVAGIDSCEDDEARHVLEWCAICMRCR
ncbi:putative acyl-CoA oxidase domain protein [Mycobacterium xenopi 3993]|nr:putative acyl-CoA oxidase domain protein [Mycobacterium xenopi 3993]